MAKNLDFSFALDWSQAEREGEIRYKKYKGCGTNPPNGPRGQVAGVAGEMAFSRDFMLEREADIEGGSQGDKGVDFTIATGETVDVKAREMPSVVSEGRLIIAPRQSYGVFLKTCEADVTVFAWRPKGTNRIRLDGWLSNAEVERFPLKTWIKGGFPSFTIPTEEIHPIETLLNRHICAPSDFAFHLEMSSGVFGGTIIKFAAVSRAAKSFACVDGVIMTAAHLEYIGQMEYDKRKDYFLALLAVAKERGCLSSAGEIGEEVEAANDTVG